MLKNRQQQASHFDDDLAARQSRWGSLISELENDWDSDGDGDSDGNKHEDSAASPPAASPPMASISAASSLREAANRLRSGPMPAASFSFPKWSNAADRPLADASLFLKWSAPGGHALDGLPPLPLRGAAAATSEPAPPPTLREWIACHAARARDRRGRRRYLEEAAAVLYALAKLAAGADVGRLPAEDDEAEPSPPAVHPALLRAANIVVRDGDNGPTVELLQSGDSIFHRDPDPAGGAKARREERARRTRQALAALGQLGQELFMGTGAETPAAAEDAAEDAIEAAGPRPSQKTQPVNEDEILRLLRRRPGPAEDRAGGGDDSATAALRAAEVPLPLRRLVADLRGGHDNIHDCRPDAFRSLSDACDDLRRMTEHPAAFVHDDALDRWRLEPGRAVHGRGDAARALDAAAARTEHLCSRRQASDPLFSAFDGIGGLSASEGGRGWREVVAVRGHAGAGKSRLVEWRGRELEGRGWVFLRCK